MTGKTLLKTIPRSGTVFKELYGPLAVESAQRRYAGLVEGLLEDSPEGFPQAEFPETRGELRVFTAPGRTELGGNHTDHNQGKVLAASIQLDAVAVVAPRHDKRVFFRSAGYPDVAVNLAGPDGSPDLDMRNGETGTTAALVRGIAAELSRRGTEIGGFTANAASTVLPGSGLSSSAAVEALFGKIFDSLYGEGKRSALELAQIGQIAENTYFGKPCGLEDQTACAFGGAVAIDFGDPLQPLVRQIGFDPEAEGYALCVVDTHGSHADLTPDYAAIPAEMQAVARLFGKEVLREITLEQVLDRAAAIREAAGDRALLRAIHFFNENRRVDAQLAALENRDIDRFLSLVNQSGYSSSELLQNIYSPKQPAEQGISTALALTRNFIAVEAVGKGACRVHGGGFAGTIQAYIPLDRMAAYRRCMEGVFGAGAVTALRIRPVGAVELRF
jgi:galactokinase